MPGVRLQLALRWAALYLFMVALCFGPAGVLGATALSAVSPDCGASCPCDEAQSESSEHAHVGQDEHHAALGTDAHEDCAPSDECPDDCPDCHCSMGASLAVIPLSLTALALTSTSVQLFTPMTTPALGACVAVFRPPRSVA